MESKQIGRYEIVGTLGRGAMGLVHLARDPIIDRELALKTLRLDIDEDVAQEFRERFMREARAAGRLSHPGIVTIHDVGEDTASGIVFIAMEYVRGYDLKRILATGHRFSQAEIARIVAEVASALDYAHAEGVVHRDIKPANIILTRDGTAKIMDFGVARLESSNLTVEGQFIGTPNFMSPEQITGQQVDGRSDIFSLGVVLYLMLTGQRPFASETLHGVTMKIVQESCPIPSTMARGLLPAFNPVVMKCLEKNPDNRYQSGREVATVLTALRNSLIQHNPALAERALLVFPELDAEDKASKVVQPEPEELQEVAEGAAPRTRISSPRTGPIPQQKPLIRVPDRLQRVLGAREGLRRLPLPEVAFREVQASWALRIIAVWLVICAAAAGGLRLLVDDGPFPAPSLGNPRNLNLTRISLNRAQELLAAGDIQGATTACQAVLDQAPASPAARDVMVRIHQLHAAQLSNSQTQQRIADLLDEGRTLYRSGQYQEAAERFRAILELDPAHLIAGDYLQLAEDRSQQATPDVQPPASSPQPAAPLRLNTTRSAPRSQSSGQAQIQIRFDAPINAGSITLSRDSELLKEIPFDFTRKGFLGLKKKGTGQIRDSLTVASGTQNLGVQLTGEEGADLGSATFHDNLPPNSQWTLRIDLLAGASEARFYLVKAK
jgi:serine/threonine protein kinase